MEFRLSDRELEIIADQVASRVMKQESSAYRAAWVRRDGSQHVQDIYAWSAELAVVLAKDARIVVPATEGATDDPWQLRLVNDDRGRVLWERLCIYPGQ